MSSQPDDSQRKYTARKNRVVPAKPDSEHTPLDSQKPAGRWLRVTGERGAFCKNDSRNMEHLRAAAVFQDEPALPICNFRDRLLNLEIRADRAEGVIRMNSKGIRLLLWSGCLGADILFAGDMRYCWGAN